MIITTVKTSVQPQSISLGFFPIFSTANSYYATLLNLNLTLNININLSNKKETFHLFHFFKIKVEAKCPFEAVSLWVDLFPNNTQRCEQAFCIFHNMSTLAIVPLKVCLCKNHLCASVCLHGEFYLFRFEAWWHPSVFLQSAAGVVVGGGVPLEVKHELRHRPLHVQSHHHRLIPLSTAHTERMSLNKGL